MATISVFLGSIRTGRQGKKVADWVVKKLKERGHTVHLIDPLEQTELQVFTARIKYIAEPSEQLKTVQKWIIDSDGFIAVSPEYNHSYSGALKNALDFFLEEYQRKPFAIVTYSAGPMGGIRAAEHLRSVCAELGASAIPISLGISSLANVFEENGDLKDVAWDKRIAKMLDEFDWYVEALAQQRKKQ